MGGGISGMRTEQQLVKQALEFRSVHEDAAAACSRLYWLLLLTILLLLALRNTLARSVHQF